MGVSRVLTLSIRGAPTVLGGLDVRWRRRAARLRGCKCGGGCSASSRPVPLVPNL